MRRLVVGMLLLLVPAVFAAEPPPWFPKLSGIELTHFKHFEYSDLPVPLEKGTQTFAGRYWAFDMNKPQPNVWTDTGEQLLREGFKFVHGSMSTIRSSAALQKGEGEHAIYVRFSQCCNSVYILEVAPNPYHVALRAPSATPEVFGDKDDLPYVSPILGSKLLAGRVEAGSFRQPGCTKSDARGTERITRIYQAPAGISDDAVMEAYESAFKAAGWDPVCRTSHHEMDARYAKNGRDIGVYIASGDFEPRYSIDVVDTGAGLRAALQKDCKAPLYGVNFDFDKATLRPDAEPALNQLLSVLKDDTRLAVEIGGHTDNVGKPDYNLKLSDERATAVKQWLIAHGIAASRLSSHGYGDTQPLAPNGNDENRAKNRRVEVKCSK